jgi:phosphatidylglycerophosphate synthase
LVGIFWAGLVVALVPVAPVISGLLILISTLTDGIDGCVAALTDRATKFGFVLDSVVDRASDGLFLWALVRAGGDSRLAVAAGCALAALEYTRSRAGNAGFGEIGVITVGERATRTIAASLGLVGAQVLSSKPWVGPNVGLAITVAACCIGTAQLGRYLWKHFR